MAICGCSSGLVVTAAAALLLLPAQYLVPAPREPAPGPAPGPPPGLALVQAPPLDLLVTLLLLALGLLTYLAEYIQRKIMEKRIVKLNRYLQSSVERLRAWDAQQEQLETTLKLVQNATSEYNLLLYLLLRQHRALAAPPAGFFDKPRDDLAFLNTSVEA